MLRKAYRDMSETVGASETVIFLFTWCHMKNILSVMNCFWCHVILKN